MQGSNKEESVMGQAAKRPICFHPRPCGREGEFTQCQIWAAVMALDKNQRRVVNKGFLRAAVATANEEGEVVGAVVAVVDTTTDPLFRVLLTLSVAQYAQAHRIHPGAAAVAVTRMRSGRPLH